MFGWRGRIGLIVPCSNSTFEPEMKAMCPEGVEVYATRIAFTPDEQGLRDMRQHVRRASRELAAEGLCDIIVFGCTVGSMIEGKGYDEKICGEITADTGVPAIAATTAVIAALKALGVSRIVVATPYRERSTKSKKRPCSATVFRWSTLRAITRTLRILISPTR